MSIIFCSEHVPFPKLNKTILKKWIKTVVAMEGKIPGNISLVFCSDDYLLEINKKFLDHDYFTDVITFDYVEGDTINGDILISIDRLKENALSFGVELVNECHRIVVHGILHLLGYSDKSKSEKKLMTSKEDFYLEVLANFDIKNKV